MPLSRGVDGGGTHKRPLWRGEPFQGDPRLRNGEIGVQGILNMKATYNQGTARMPSGGSSPVEALLSSVSLEQFEANMALRLHVFGKHATLQHRLWDDRGATPACLNRIERKLLPCDCRHHFPRQSKKEITYRKVYTYLPSTLSHLAALSVVGCFATALRVD